MLRCLRDQFYTFYTLIVGFGFSFLIIACTPNQNCINDWKRMNLKGSIKQVDVSEYTTYQNYQSKKNAQNSFCRFNDQGLITKLVQFMNNDQIHWMKYLYKGDSVWIDEIRELKNNTEHPQAYWLYKLDERGGQKMVKSILLDSSINFQIDMKLNTFGMATEIVYSKQKYIDRLPCKISKIYDDKGILQEELTYHYNSSTQRCDDNPVRSVFKHNKQRDIIRDVIYNKEGKKQKVVSYDYKYDKQGNWIYKLQYSGDYPKKVFVRTITYFDTAN